MRRHCIFWNLQRLFDPSGLPVSRTLGVTKATWSHADYERKTANIAACLRAATQGRPPALLAFAEIESVRVLADLRAALGWKELAIVDELAPDPSLDGLDVAMMIDQTVFDMGSIEARSIALDNRFSTRDLSFVRVRPHGSDRHVVFVVAHWPSRVISEGESLRFAYSIYLYRLLVSVLQFSKASIVSHGGEITMPAEHELLQRWNTPCIVMGDFNDEPYDLSIREALSSTRFEDLVLRRGALRGKSLVEVDNYFDEKFSLFNPCWRLTFSDDGSVGGTYYRSEWRTYDQLLLTHGALLEDAPVRYVSDSVCAVRMPDLDDGKVSMCTGSGAPRSFDLTCPHGTSDHFPLRFEIDVPD